MSQTLTALSAISVPSHPLSISRTCHAACAWKFQMCARGCSRDIENWESCPYLTILVSHISVGIIQCSAKAIHPSEHAIGNDSIGQSSSRYFVNEFIQPPAMPQDTPHLCPELSTVGAGHNLGILLSSLLNVCRACLRRSICNCILRSRD